LPCTDAARASGTMPPRARLASVPRILALAAGCSALVEAAQYVLQLDRVSSVDDVLLNTVGAGLTALASLVDGSPANTSDDAPQAPFRTLVQ
jgi:hypothetical protein